MTSISDTRIAFIGGGNMARSLIGGLVESGTPVGNLLVCEPDDDIRDRLVADFGVRTSDDNLDALAMDVIVLAVKPQVMQQVCARINATNLGEGPVYISIAAGIPMQDIDRWLGGDRVIVRCMPNTPALLGCGATGLVANARADSFARETAQQILDSVGITVWVEDESLIDAVTAVSGSGPAYYFLMMEAMVDAGVELGLDRATAESLVAQTALGAARMNAEGEDNAAILRQRVTSKGGTTEQAIMSFEKDGLRDIVRRALTAARDRSITLADELTK